MSETGLDPAAQRALLAVLNDNGDRRRARRTVTALEDCCNTFVTWKAAAAEAKRDGRRVTAGHRSPETQKNLARIAKLSAALRLEATILPTGRVFLAGLWPEYVTDMAWKTFVEALINVETLAELLRKQGTRRPGAPADRLRHAFEEMVAWALVREGYAISTTGDGVYAQVMQIMLDAVGEQAPVDLRRIARETAKKVRAFQKHEALSQ
jgi:hypothetical protein